MKHTYPCARLAAALLSASALLAACGGGGDASPTASNPPAPTPTDAGTVPASATASPQAFVTYLATLPASDASADTSDPLNLTTTMPPVTDTDEPLAL